MVLFYFIQYMCIYTQSQKDWPLLSPFWIDFGVNYLGLMSFQRILKSQLNYGISPSITISLYKCLKYAMPRTFMIRILIIFSLVFCWFYLWTHWWSCKQYYSRFIHNTYYDTVDWYSIILLKSICTVGSASLGHIILPKLFVNNWFLVNSYLWHQ